MPTLSKAQARKRLNEASKKLFTVYSAVVTGKSNANLTVRQINMLNNMGVDLMKMADSLK